MEDVERKRAQTKAWFAAHPNYHRERYAADPADGRERTRRYREKLRAKGRKETPKSIEYARDWRSRNREQQRAYFARYRRDQRARTNAIGRNYKARRRRALGSHTAKDVEQ